LTPIYTYITSRPLDSSTIRNNNHQERKNNRLRDFVAVAGPLGVTHFVIMSRTEHGTNMRIARVPRGPTLSFQVKTYSLAKDISAMQKTPKSPGLEFQVAPLLVLNNFGDSNEMKLMSTVFQNMFPPINIQTVRKNERKKERVKEEDLFTLREITVTKKNDLLFF